MSTHILADIIDGSSAPIGRAGFLGTRASAGPQQSGSGPVGEPLLRRDSTIGSRAVTRYVSAGERVGLLLPGVRTAARRAMLQPIERLFQRNGST